MSISQFLPIHQDFSQFPESVKHSTWYWLDEKSLESSSADGFGKVLWQSNICQNISDWIKAVSNWTKILRAIHEYG